MRQPRRFDLRPAKGPRRSTLALSGSFSIEMQEVRCRAAASCACRGSVTLPETGVQTGKDLAFAALEAVDLDAALAAHRAARRAAASGALPACERGFSVDLVPKNGPRVTRWLSVCELFSAMTELSLRVVPGMGVD